MDNFFRGVYWGVIEECITYGTLTVYSIYGYFNGKFGLLQYFKFFQYDLTSIKFTVRIHHCLEDLQKIIFHFFHGIPCIKENNEIDIFLELLLLLDL